MVDICDRCSETDEEEEYGDCPKCGWHLCIDCLGMHDCEEEEQAPTLFLRGPDGKPMKPVGTILIDEEVQPWVGREKGV